MQFSPATGQFYDGPPCPEDVVTVTAAQQTAALQCLAAGGTISVDANGNPVPNYSAGALAILQASCSAQIDAARDGALQASTVTYNGNVYQADPGSVARLTSATLAAASGVPLPAGFSWRTLANTNVPFTQADLVALGTLMLAETNSIFQQSWTLKAQIAAATTAAGVLAIAWP